MMPGPVGFPTKFDGGLPLRQNKKGTRGKGTQLGKGKRARGETLDVEAHTKSRFKRQLKATSGHTKRPGGGK